MDGNGEHGMLIWIIHDNMIIMMLQRDIRGLTLASLETETDEFSPETWQYDVIQYNGIYRQSYMIRSSHLSSIYTVCLFENIP